MDENDAELKKLMDEINIDDKFNTLNQITSSEPPVKITDDNINDFVIEKMATMISSNLDTMKVIENSIRTAFDAEEVEAYSKYVQSIVSAAEALNKINIQNKKAKTSMELKQLELKANKETSKLLGKPQTNNNILIATREEIISKFLDKVKKDIDVTEEPYEPK